MRLRATFGYLESLSLSGTRKKNDLTEILFALIVFVNVVGI